MIDRLLDEKQAAAILGVTTRCLQKWRYEKQGPPYVNLAARAIRYRETDLEKYISEHRVNPS